ncbi:hypothetical protein [Lysobacter hankyongensis]|uniref:Uncharacterized protein n=1 Tax=Lysobacter hankyongensis TaxID=1176535 RepID=A0ABP9BMK7_9GAMM
MRTLLSSFASLSPLALVAGMALAANPGRERIVVRSEQDLHTAWIVLNPNKDIDLLTLKGTRLRYGCVNVAYRIESDGRIAEGTRLLAYRADRAHAASENTFDFMGNFVKSALPGYTPAPGTTAPVATYTSRSIPVFGAETESTLSPIQIATLKAALRKACAIDDLPGRLKNGLKHAVRLETLPPMETLLGNPQVTPDPGS